MNIILDQQSDSHPEIKIELQLQSRSILTHTTLTEMQFEEQLFRIQNELIECSKKIISIIERY